MINYNNVLKLYPEFTHINGPYEHQGRIYYRICKGSIGLTVNRSKLLLETKLNRRLIGGEEADHIDNDKTNDSPNNLQILSKSDNIKKSIPLRKPKEILKAECPHCGKFIILTNKQRNKYFNGIRIFYCSSTCSSLERQQEIRNGVRE